MNLFRRFVPTALAESIETRRPKRKKESHINPYTEAQMEQAKKRLGVSGPKCGISGRAIADLRSRPKILMDRFISAGHLRKTPAEMELEKGEITFEQLESLGSNEAERRICVVIDLYADKYVIDDITMCNN